MLKAGMRTEEVVRTIDLTKVYENPLAVAKMLTYTEFNAFRVLLHNPTAITTREILRKIVLDYVEFIRCLDSAPKNAQYKQILKLPYLPKAEQKAGVVNQLLKKLNLPTLPTYNKVANALTSLFNNGLVGKKSSIEKGATKKRPTAVYYVEPEFFKAFERRRDELRPYDEGAKDGKITTSKLEALFYFNNVYQLDEIKI